MDFSYASKTSAFIKSIYKNNPWKGRFILSLFILLLVLTLIRAALPQTIIYSTTSWLKQQNIHASIEAVNINLFSGTVSLTKARGSRNGDPLFNIGLIELHWHWAPLSDKTVKLTKIVLDQFSLNIEQYSDEIIIGGVAIPLAPAAKKKDESTDNIKDIKSAKEIHPWAASLGRVIFTNLDLCYLQHLSPVAKASAKSKYVDYCIKLEEMSWTGSLSYATDKKLVASNVLPVSSTGDFTLNGLTITDNILNKKLLVSKSNTINEVTVSGLANIHIKELKMNGLSAMQREHKQHKDAIRFNQLTINDIKLNNLNTLSIREVELTNPGLYLVKQNQFDWEYQQWIPAFNSADNKSKTDNKHELNGSSFKVSINNITINNADLCYLEKATALYYCYSSDRFYWQGSLIYDTEETNNNNVALTPRFNLSGNLVLSRAKIRNFSIERNLLELKSLKLTHLNIKNINHISVDDVHLEGLSALQRSNKQNDATASFEELVINNINYTKNNISIDTIKLNGLANNFSKNRNGEWEHSKWLTKNKQTVIGNSDTGNQKSTTAKPLILSLNSLKIATDNKILFTDNSTEPAMKVGLQKLSLDISKLNSTKPEGDSPFKLFAKTTRHSTINIEGTAKPFADKISFDAKGKLKGFDLRAASPASKKAIGHIIKSGQLDADLTLFAKQGELESNIALSLYHFTITPISTKDAEALDEKFGMPLNQTLVLLRDKDDSIHLDIPVTGNVNNPDFDPMDAIIKATSKAATVTLITFYTPYGLVYAGGNVLFNLATAMNFDSVEFKPGSTEIENENKDALDKLAILMNEKPQIHLSLCGLTNTADLYALFPALKEKQKVDADDNNNAAQLTNEQHSALLQLAQKRQINTKNYLIKESAVTHDRLILCAPEHQTHEDAIAGVEINI